MQLELFADIETTGLDKATDEILSIAIADSNGDVLYNSFLRPQYHNAWPKAQQQNNISPEFIFAGDFPTFEEAAPELIEITSGNRIITYNKAFDCPFMAYEFYRYRYRQPWAESGCSMERFARYIRKPSTRNHSTGGFKNWKLAVAAELTGFVWPSTKHTALADALANRHVWLWLDKYEHDEAIRIDLLSRIIGIDQYHRNP